MIKIKYALFLLLISQSYSCFMNSFDMNEDYEFVFDDIFDEGEDKLDPSHISIDTEEIFMDSEETSRELEQHRTAHLSACQVVEILTDPDRKIQADVLLQEDLYRHTNPNNSRSLLDLPGFYHHYFLPRKNYFWTQLFYNQTSNGYYTKESTQLQSYILLNNPNLIRVIDDQNPPVNVPIILSIFSNMKLQDRRLGFMLGGQHVWNKWHVRAYAPIYYLERNVSLTDEEQKLLERAGMPAVDDPMDFARKHLIIDKVGCGDARLELGYTAFDNCTFMARVGGQLTIPSAMAFKQGLYGTHFSKNTPAPDFSLLDFINTVIPEQDMDKGAIEAEKFLVAAVDRLATMVLETGMGNEGHTGIGVFTDNQLALSDSWTLRSKSSLEYLTPRTEKRFYIMKKTAAEFTDRNYTTTVPASVCDENLAFLNEQLIETLFPTMFQTRISPGFIFLWNTSLTYQGELLDFQFGYDLYWQDKEKLGTINGTPAQVAKLRKDIAVKPGAYQSKLFGDLIYKKKGTCRDWHFGFHLDATLLSSGIGRDFTGAFYFDMTI